MLVHVYRGLIQGRAQGGPQGFQLPPQAYDAINNQSPALPNVPPKFLQLLILPPQGRMSRLNTVYAHTVYMYVLSYQYTCVYMYCPLVHSEAYYLVSFVSISATMLPSSSMNCIQISLLLPCSLTRPSQTGLWILRAL